MKLHKFGIDIEIPNPNDKHLKLGIMARTFLISGVEHRLFQNSQLMTKQAIDQAESKEELLKSLGII